MQSCSKRLEAIADWHALRLAWQTYRCGKRRTPDVAAFEVDADRQLLRLSRALLEGTYRHGPHRVLQVCDPKPRRIAVAQVRDRVVHTAVHSALAPFFDARLTDDTYACREGRGAHRACWKVLELTRRHPFRMHLDIRRYYPSIDHGILLGLLAPRLRDARVLELLKELLSAGWALYRRRDIRTFYGLEPLFDGMRAHGLPIGSLTSQWWGNLYLDGLDHYIKRVLKVPGYVRYMDDIVCYGPDKVTLTRWRGELQQWLREERRLELKPSMGQVVSTSMPHTCLGYRITPKGIDPGPRMVRRFKQRLKRRALGPHAGWRQALVGWRGMVQVA